MTQKKPELLAPAGDMACALAAFDAGADAVYAGLSRFNARERATSFTMADFGRLCQFAHSHGKKVYLALNTLIRDAELPDFATDAAMAMRYRPDGVIVQDLGALRFFRKYYPEVPLHASTQMGFHNLPGLRLAHRLGLSRVILERQITLDELKIILPQSPLETEIFVHGALCISLSGVCLFSSWQSGGSGNRGRCKQPCRRRYEWNGKAGFPLSPADLSLLRRTDELARLGATSFKIEGRLRKPDYLSAVTTAYRTVIDDPRDLAVAVTQLKTACGRTYSDGFLTPASMRSLIRADVPGIQGERCGTVKFSRRGALGISVDANGLHLGDRIRLQGSDGQPGPALTLTRILRDNCDINHARAGDIIMVPYDDYVAPGTEIFRIGTSGKSFDRAVAALPPWRDPIDFTVTVDNEGFRAEVHRLHWSYPVALADAQKNPADEAKIRDAFAVIANPDEAPFRAGTITVKLAPGRFIPDAVLKQARKAFWTFLFDHLSPDAVHSTAPLTQLVNEMQQISPAPFDEPQVTILQEDTDDLLPPFIPESRIDEMKNRIRKTLDRGIRTFRVTSLGTFALLRETAGDLPLKLKSHYPLTVTNLQSVLFLQDLGFSTVMLSPELDLESMRRLAECSPLCCEVYAYGRLPVLVTRAELPVPSAFADRSGSWRVTPPDAFGLRIILPEIPLAVPEIPRTDRFIDLRHATPDEPHTATFNLNRSF